MPKVTEELPHEAVPLPNDPRIAVAILGERMKGMGRQVDKIEESVDKIFDLVREVADKSANSSCPHAPSCGDVKKQVERHSALINKLEGARTATVFYCSGIAFVVGIVSPYVLKAVFK